MQNLNMKRLGIAALLLVIAALGPTSPAHAQCGGSNCIVPTAPPGTNNNEAASTAFAQAAATAAAAAAVAGLVPPLTSPTTFYLNGDAINPQTCGTQTCQPGSNSNNCLTIATPCQTIGYTLSYLAARYNFAGQGVIVQASKGTYNECVLLPPYLNTNGTDKQVFLQGNPTVSDVVVNCASGNAFSAVNSPQGWVLKNITAKASNACAYVDYNGKAYWDGGNFAGCTNYDVQAVNNGAFFEFINDPYTISDSPQCHASVVDGGEIIWRIITATMSGTPAFAVGLLCSQKNYGILDDTSLTLSGSFTGPKYALVGAPIVFSSGATASTANSTQYIGQGSISNSENNYFVIPSPASGFVDLYVNASTSPGTGQSYTFTARFAGSNSTLTCAISGAAASCSDQLHLGFGGSGT